MALNKGIWDPKLRGTNIKGTNLKSLINPTPYVSGVQGRVQDLESDCPSDPKP